MLCVTGLYLREMTNMTFSILHLNVELPEYLLFFLESSLVSYPL